MHHLSDKELLTSGKISINKLTRVTSVATPENESFWAAKVQQLSQSAIETLVRDEEQNGLLKPKIEEKSLRAQKFEDLNLAPDVMKELLELQQKGIDVNQVLREFLEQRKIEIAREKEALSVTPAKSRHIPVKILRHLQREFGTLCSIVGCRRAAQVIHHTQRFALSGRHDPLYLAPLCREHHAIAHAIDARVQTKRNATIKKR